MVGEYGAGKRSRWLVVFKERRELFWARQVVEKEEDVRGVLLCCFDGLLIVEDTAGEELRLAEGLRAELSNKAGSLQDWTEALELTEALFGFKRDKEVFDFRELIKYPLSLFEVKVCSLGGTTA